MTDGSPNPPESARDDQPEARPRRRWFRWFMRGLGALALLLILASIAVWLWGRPYIHRTIETKLQDVVEGHLNARLAMGQLEYIYPYGVIVNDVSLTTTTDPPVTLASFEQLRLELGEIPIGSGPLVIKRIEVSKPTLHVIQTADGIVGQRDLILSDEQRARRPKPPPKLSEVFDLRYLLLESADIRYEDRRDPNAVPLQWSDIDIELNAEPKGGASHAYSFDAVSGTLAHVQSTGTLDLDTFVLDIASARIEAWVTSDDSVSPLPPAAQKLLRQFKVSGSTGLYASGTVPLRQPMESTLTAYLWVRDARGAHPLVPDDLQDLDLSVSVSKAGQVIHGQLDHLAVRSGSTAVSVQELKGSYDLDAEQWQASPLRLAAAYTPTEKTKGILAQPATVILTAQVQQLDALDHAMIDIQQLRILLPNIDQTVAVAGKVEINDEQIEVPSLSIEGLGGTASLNALYDRTTDTATTTYSVKSMQIGLLKTLLRPETEEQMKGLLDAQGTAGLVVPQLDTLNAKGRAHVTEAEFAKIPVLAGLTKFIGIGSGMFVVSEANVEYSIANKVVDVERAIAHSDAFRLRATGTINFDKELNLWAYISDAKDWDKGFQKMDIPILSEVGGALAGGTQSLIRGVMKQFTSLRIKGTLDDPKITPDPAPAITGRITKLFSKSEPEENKSP